MTATKGTLLLLPNVLGAVKHHDMFLPPSIDRAAASLQGLMAESESGGRRFLGRFLSVKTAQQIPIAVVGSDASRQELDFFLEPLLRGERWGLVSDAGMPCVADPGAAIVRRARQLGIAVQAFVGPSSVTLALMLSGLPGQRFHFRGYLAKDPEKRKTELADLQKVSRADQATQIFIEAPFRNRATLEKAIENLDPSTWLCVAWDLTLPTQGVISQPISQWHKTPLPNVEKKPAIFLVYSGPL